MFVRRIVLWVLVAVGLAASVFVAVQRAAVESRNRAVELVVDYDEVAQIAASTAVTPSDVLRKFKDVGVTSVAVTEQTIQDLLDDRSFLPIGKDTYSVDSHIAQRVIPHLRRALPHVSGRMQVFHRKLISDPGLRMTGVPPAYLKLIPVGLPEEAMNSAREAGLEVVARLTNYPGATPEAVQAILADVKSKGIGKIIFSGDQVLGFKGTTAETAEALEHNGLYFGMVELANQKGESAISKRAPGSVIVVHSISSNEMPALTVSTVIERFRKSVRERGVRMCYVRTYDMASEDALESNLSYVAGIAGGLRGAGYTLKSSHPLDDFEVPLLARALAGIGAAAGVVLLILSVVNLSGVATVIWSLLALAVCAGLASHGDEGRKAVALLAAVVFPTLAAISAVRGAPQEPTHAPRPLLRAWGRLLIAVTLTAVGGVLIVGLLSERSFMLRIDQFAGVKLAHLLPVLLLVLVFAGGVAWRSDKWSAQRRKFTQSLKQLAGSPVLTWQAVGVAAVLSVLVVMVMRSGNAGLEVSALELKLRALLDKALYVRPRTKEFLIGYPALLVGIAFALRGRRRWAAPLVVIGSIGLISELNSFCHIHTPLVVTAWRVAVGAIAGSVVGIVAYLFVRRLPGKEKEASGSAECGVRNG